MKGAENNIFKFMSGGERYLIPCYQRPYSWTEDQCRTLFDDMIHLHEQRKHDFDATHFIGSIVCQQVKGGQSGYFIIDGQQRLTTMYLFYLALYRIAEKRSLLQANASDIAPSIKFKILSDSSSSMIGALGKHRFDLTDNDQAAMDKLFAGDENEFIKDSLVTVNYRLFCQWIEEKSELTLLDLFSITQGLVFIEIELDPGDDAQLIFESLNSKGLDLSEGDKVRNFILMGFSQDVVKTYFRELWRPMEQNCQGELSAFIQYFLAIKYGRAPSMKSLYLDFKDYVQRNNLDKLKVMEELLAYSKLFARINSCSYELFADNDTELSSQEREALKLSIEHRLRCLKHLNYSVRISFIMHCMRLHQLHEITGQELLETLNLIETFLLRRWVCGIPSQGLNRWFQALHAAISRDDGKDDFVSKLVRLLCPEGKAILPNCMPTDDAFSQALHNRDLYSKARNKESMFYLFERLENAGSREQVQIFGALELKPDAYSIEHVMPQKLTEEWRSELGPDAEEIHHTWLHRLANLTVTAYNSKYSNSSFADKCSMSHGFASSPLRLNREIADFKHWGPKELEQRAQMLIEKALTIWPYPSKDGATQSTSQVQTLSTETKQSVLKPALVKSQATTVVAQDADEAVLTPIHTGLQQSLFDEDTASAPTQEDHSAEAEQQLQQEGVFDYCLADEPRDFSRTRLAGCEFLGQHYDVKKWAPLQRMLLTQLYQSNPERLRSWLTEKWGNFNILAQFFKTTPDFTVAKSTPSAIFKLDEGMYLNSNQDVMDKVKLLKQLFELMEVDPKDLTLHLVKIRNMD